MKQFVMTRSAYGPSWSLDANERRLRITNAVTARLMKRQTVDDWVWVVMLDERDPFLRERMHVYAEAAPDFWPIVCRPPVPRHLAADFMPDWREFIPADDTVIMTRLDDDDGLAVDALARYRAVASARPSPTVLVLPEGIRVWNGCEIRVRHELNAMHTLVTPRGSSMSVYDYGHRELASVGPVVMVDDRPGWLWVRHLDTLSGDRRVDIAIQQGTRALFPVDWDALYVAWHEGALVA